MTSRFRLQLIIAFIIVVGEMMLLSWHGGAAAPASGMLEENPALYAEISTTSSPPPLGASSKRINLPILVYHVIRPSYPSDSAAVRAIALTPETFDAEMSYLKTSGYHVVQFSNLESYFANGTPLPPKPVILSFDDGWGDQFKYAFPLLKKHAYLATFFVFTNAIGHKGFLTRNELMQLVAAGMTIGDHTRSHPYLTSITSTSTLVDEIQGSKALLEKELGIPITEFAYPFGQYNAGIVSLVQKAGYKSARGDYYSGEQSAENLFELSAMNAPTTMARFKEKFPAK